MSKQDEKLRQRRRMQDRAVELASKNRWTEAVEVNQQMLALDEDADVYNRLGKAFFEMGRLRESFDSYQNALRMNPSNGIARKNIERLEQMLAHSDTAVARDRTARQLIDLRLFITEIGKTALSTLVDVPRNSGIEAIVTGEKVEVKVEGRNVVVYDAEGNMIGRIEPKLAQRLHELMTGGNRYVAAVAQITGSQIRILIREIYQDPSQRGRVSFPGKFGEGVMHGYNSAVTYDDFDTDLMDDDDSVEEDDVVEEEAFGGDEEELGLDDIEQDMGDDDGNEE